ncbi:Bug family tripartite tricarboxylate transporter substrate binding protein [Bordetella genomosp. 9]|uniref:LacI family transcriptional regulator n=1 Tax=Bordetella genomosp. 9 TaxID=1416803 RepID=A0A1W6Z2M1_9BORD|nr:tripartite tricarboxylate transporter substrate binding protein [Bordetella genomosp. 9]ARP87605.1 hypothetical protein CAL13_16385 [Bordetella genomosp. 9]
MHISKHELAAIALLGAVIPIGALGADIEASFPQRPITLVVGYPPGGSADVLARLVAQHMENDLGQKMIIEYRPGAGGNLGAEAVARTRPDGYTMYLAGRPNTIHKVMYPAVKYDFSHDLVPIGLVASTPYVMVVDKHAPITSVEDVVSLAKAYPGGLTCASTGTGTTEHLLCELLQQEAEIDMVHVPYRASPGAFADVIGGRVDIYIASLASTLPHIMAGNVRPVAVMANRRSPSLKDVPTIGEVGFPDLALGAWYGLTAPAGTPAHAVNRLNRAVNVLLANADVREALTQRAYMPAQPNEPSAFANVIAEETKRWTALLEQRNIKPLH